MNKFRSSNESIYERNFSATKTIPGINPLDKDNPNSTNLPQNVWQQSASFLLRLQKSLTSKIKCRRKFFSSNISAGHVDCIFDNPAKKLCKICIKFSLKQRKHLWNNFSAIKQSLESFLWKKRMQFPQTCRKWFDNSQQIFLITFQKNSKLQKKVMINFFLFNFPLNTKNAVLATLLNFFCRKTEKDFHWNSEKDYWNTNLSEKDFPKNSSLVT